MRLIERIKQIQRERNIRLNKERLQEEFQIAEQKGELWITFDGYYVLPCSMLNLEPVDALLKIRELQSSISQ